MIRRRLLLSAKSAQPHFLQGNDSARAVCTKCVPGRCLSDALSLSHLQTTSFICSTKH